MTDTAQSAESTAVDVRRKVGPVGLVGKGILYFSLGLLIINVAQGDSSSESASKAGAIENVASAPFGKFLLIILAVGLVALVAWKALQAIVGDPIDGDDASDRAKSAVKAVLYLSSAVTAVSVLIANWSSGSSGGSGGGGGGDSQQQAASVIMEWPGGRWIVMVLGLAAIGYGAYQIYEYTVNAEFMERLATTDDTTRTTIRTAGRVGYAGRALLVIGLGVFFLVAGIQHDPDEVKGLSGLLSDLSGNTLGQIVLWIIAIGTVAYGAFALAEAKFRRAY
ncbi:DUF1206 domain-containing protein [Ilumatobacter sp.]|uniref:DUF1206 domain-containing protein n=1 Tax=Ilumatobacter sp. TaxID=1967498 RepID=UPI003B52F001